MTTVEVTEVRAKDILDKTAVFYGPTMTGKSYLINAFLAALSKEVEQAIVFCTTDPQTGAYSASGMLPPQMVHSSLTQEMLESICERQDALMGAFTKANAPEVVHKLFARIPHLGKWRNIIDDINKKLAIRCSQGETANTKAYHDEAQAALCKIKKEAIRVNEAFLKAQMLTEEERFAITYMFINPRIVIVFDDCTPELNTLKKAEVIKKIFFQGRWMGITALIAAHTDKALDPEIKKGVFVSIFTHPLSVREYFERGSNNIDRETKKKAIDATAVFEEGKHQKLMYFREGYFRKLTAGNPGQFSLCNQHIMEACAKVAAPTSGGVAKNNRFYSAFRI